MKRTLAIVKPDAVRNRHAGEILARIEKEGFKILGMKLMKLDREKAAGFYIVHKERPFYDDLCRFMSSGPVVVAALEREGAVAKWREVIGATDPAQAAEGTIRRMFAESKEANAAHGSDSDENAAFEIGYFFQESELVG